VSHCGQLLAETDPPFCPNHWGYLPDDIKGELHTVAGHDAAKILAIDYIGRAEAVQARYPTRHMPRPRV
jgi:hypothetical protein